jgi:hypothetical protein
MPANPTKSCRRVGQTPSRRRSESARISPKREKLAEQLTWLINRDALGMPEVAGTSA